jgi:type IV pilus assembly protein PilV
MSMNKCLYPPRKRHAAGFTLIEVLVTVVVLAVGLLGLAALQAVALKNNRTALYHSYATFYAYDIVDAMRANRAGAIAAGYNFDFDTDAVGGTVAGDDMVAWKAALQQNLPDGKGKVTVDLQGNALIEVRWNEGVEADQTLTFKTQTSL